MAVQLARRLFTIDEYEKMIETGVIREDERVELIKGEIVKMAAIGLDHLVCVMRLDALLQSRSHGLAQVSVQNPIRLPDNSRPEPDVALLRWRDDYYAGKHPSSEDALLIIEVADSSLEDDRDVKVPIYAAAGIPELWLVNLPGKVIEVYSDLDMGEYKTVRLVGRGESLLLPGELGGSLKVDDVLG